VFFRSKRARRARASFLSRKSSGILTTLAITVSSMTLVPLVFNSQDAEASAADIDKYLSLPDTSDAGAGTGLNDGLTSGSSTISGDTAGGVIPTSTDFTAEAWVYPDSLDNGTWHQIFQQSGSSASNYGRFGLNLKTLSGNTDYAGVQVIVDGLNTSGLSSYPDARVYKDRWTHISVTVDVISDSSVELKVYLDGQLAITQTGDPNGSYNIRTDDFTVGYFPESFDSSDRHFHGAIDQVKVWDAVLSDTQVKESMHAHSDSGVSGSPSLRAHLDFNDGYADLTGNFSLSAVGSPTRAELATSVRSGSNTIVTFPRSYLTSDGGWTIPTGVSTVDAFVVGGGGGGAGSRSGSPQWASGAGGGGGVLDATALSLTGDIPIKVGQGGSGGQAATQAWDSIGLQGGDSSFGDLSAGGGGGGGCSASSDDSCPTAAMNGRPGTASGSGGSPSNFWAAYDPGLAGTASSVTYGGKSTAAVTGNSGGAYNLGGSSAAGTAGSGGGAGGAGTYNTPGAGITFNSVEYGKGGLAYGATGHSNSEPTTNTGAGGNGARDASVDIRGASGASGIVVVTYATPTYSVSYNSNGATGGAVPASQTKTQDVDLTVASNSGTLVRTGFTFAGWNDQADGQGTDYAAGSGSYTTNAAEVLYAKWTSNLVLSYDFGKTTSYSSASPTVVNDIGNSGNYDGTVEGSSYSPSNLSLNISSSAYVDVADISTDLFQTGITIDVWGELGSADVWERFIDFGEGDAEYNIQAGRFGSTAKANVEIFNQSSGTASIGNCVTVDDVLENGVQKRYTFVLDGSTCRIFVNDQQVNVKIGDLGSSAASHAYGLATSGRTLNLNYVGKSNWSADAATSGSIRALSIYAGGLTPSEIDTAFASNVAYNVTYDYDSATAGNGTANSVFTTGGTAITLPSPTKTGYTFGGWYTEDSFDNLVGAAGASYTPSADADLFAEWVLANYTVTYDANFGDTPATSSQIVVNGQATGIADSAFTREGYELVGWATAADGSGTTYHALDSITVTSDLTLYGVWESMSDIVIDYNASSFTSSSSPIVDQAGNTNATLYGSADYFAASGSNPPRVTTNTGDGNYIYTDTSLTRTEFPNDSVSIFAKVYATTANHVVVNELGSAYGAAAGWHDTQIEMVAGTYKFRLWNCSALTASSSTALNTWHTVGFTYNHTTDAMTAYIDGAEVASGTCARQTPWTLGSVNLWYGLGVNYGTDLNTSGDYYGGTNYASFQVYNTAISALQVENLSANSQVTFRTNGGSGSGDTSQNLINGTATNLLAGSFTRSGYSFDGWNTQADGSGTSYADEASVTLYSNITLYAQWAADSYTITFESGANGSGSDQTQTKTASVDLNLASTATANGWFTRTGYSVGGWSTTDGGATTNALGSTYSTDAAETFYPVWTLNTYTLTLDNEGTTTTQSVNFAATPSDPATTRTGYSLAGWSDDDDSSAEYAADLSDYTMGSANDTIYAVWTANNNTVTFDSNGGSSVADSSFVTGGSLSAPTPPTRSGYTFAGWSATNGGGNLTFDYSPGVASDITLYANWTLVNSYAEFTSANPGSGATTGKAFKNSGSVLPARTSWTIESWFYEKSHSGNQNPIVSQGSDLDSRFVAMLANSGSDRLLYVGDGSNTWATSVVNLPQEQWHHFAYSVDGTAYKLFVNGVLRAEGNLATAPSNGGSFFVGENAYYEAGDPRHVYYGHIDQVKIWSKPLTQSNVLTSMHSVGDGGIGGLENHYSFNDSSNRGNDDAGSSDLTLHGTGTAVAYSSFGLEIRTPSSGLAATFGDAYSLITQAAGGLGAKTFTASGLPSGLSISASTGLISGTPTAVGTSAVVITVTDEESNSVSTGSFNMVVSAKTLDVATAPTVTVPAGELKEISVTWSAVTNASSYSLKVYSAADSFVTALLTLTGLTGTSKTITVSDFAGIADDTEYKVSITAIGTGNYASSSESSKSDSATTNATYVVSFNSNGGSSVADSSFVTGGSLSAPTPPTRSGYTFAGWSATNGGGNLTFDYSPGVASDITLYANWTLVSIEASHDTFVQPSASAQGSSANLVLKNAGNSVTNRYNRISLAKFEYDASIDWDGSVLEVYVTSNNAGSGSAYNSIYTTFNVNVYGSTDSTWDEDDLTFTTADSSSQGWGINTSNWPWTPNSATLLGTISVPTNSTVGGKYALATDELDTFLDGDSDGSVTLFFVRSDTDNQANLVFASKENTTYAGPTLFLNSSGYTYTVAYDINGGSGTLPSPGTFTDGGADYTVATPSSVNAPSGEEFTGWNTVANGSGTDYAAGATYNTSRSVTLYAQYSAITYTVTYDAGTDGSGSDQTSSKTDGVNLALANSLTANSYFTRTGYTVTGWSTTDGGAQDYALGANYTTDADETLYPVWTADAYTLTLDNEGTTTTQSVNLAATPSDPATTRTGYSLAGWSDDDDSSAEYAADLSDYTMGSANDTIYAVWTANNNTVTFDNNSGSGTMSDQIIVSGTATTLTANTMTRTGFTFDGWNTQADGNGTDYADEESVTLTGDLDLFAQWIGNDNTVTFDNNSGSGTMTDQTIVSGTATTLTDNTVTRTGYTFDGWNTAADGSGDDYADEESVTLIADLDLFAQWTANNNTVSFSSGSGSGTMADQTIVTDVATNLRLNTFTRTGYSFDGWETSGGTPYDDQEQVTLTGDLALIAQWSANTYTVIYEYNDATGGNGTASETFTTAGTVITLPTPVRTGYTFGGWYSDSALTSSVGAAGASYSPTLNLTVYAKWTADTRTVTYNMGSHSPSGSVPTDSSTYIIGDDVVIKANSGSLARTGYTFAGWVTNSDGSGTAMNVGETLTVSTTDIDLYPQWSAATYTVTYDSNGATGGSLARATDSYTTNQSPALSLADAGTLTKTGYSFSQWSATPGGSAVSDPYTTNTDVTLYAIWTLVDYTFTYDLNTGTGSAPADQDANIQETVTISDIGAASKTGHWFGGWNTASDGSGTSYGSGVSVLMPLNGETLYAVWVPDAYKIYYSANGGTGGPDLSATDGYDTATFGANYSIRPKNDLARSGYTFEHWTLNAAGTGNQYDQAQNQVGELNVYVPSATTTFYAQWSAISYSLTFDQTGGSVSTGTLTRTIGQTLTMPTAGTKTGYTFDSWSDGTNNYPAGSSYTVGASAASFTAQWTPNVYAVTYDWQGGTSSTPKASDNYTVGTGNMTLPTASGSGYTRDGYTFAGWSTTARGSEVASFQPTADDVLYAVWDDGNYTLSYDAQGGNAGSGLGTVARTGSVTLPTPTREGFVFLGWYTAASGGTLLGVSGASYTPTASTTFYARWVQRSLFGVDLATLDTAATLTIGGDGSGGSITRNHAASSTSATVSIPDGALDAGTVVSARYFRDTDRQSDLISTENNYIFSLLVSWLTGTGTAATVPDTAAGKPITVTLTSDAIQAGQMIYQVIGDAVTELGRATTDGSVVVELTEDPEIVVAGTKPTAPQSVTVTPGDTEATISWSAPASTGGSAVSSYTVTTTPGSETCTTATTSCTITGLTNGTTYAFAVTATNSIGTSAAASSNGTVTAATYTVTFDANGGRSVTAGSFISGGSVSAPTSPARAGYTFNGWSTTLDRVGTKVTFPYSPGVSTNITLYALWTAVSSGAPVATRATPTPTPSEPVRPTAPVTPVTRPIGTVAGSSEEVSVVADERKENLVARGAGWELEVAAQVADPEKPGSTKPVAIKEDLNLEFQIASKAVVAGTGLKPSTKVTVWVFSEPTYVGQVETGLDGAFASAFVLPASILPGNHTLQLLTEDNLGREITLNIPITVKGKVTVGTFKGYLALYTKDLMGQKLSARVAGKWLVQNPIAAYKDFGYSRVVRQTGAGYKIYVDLYLNSTFLRRDVITTK